MVSINTVEQHIFSNITFSVPTPDGSMFVSIIENATREPIAIQINIGKCGASIAAWATALSSMLTLALDKGVKINDLIEELSLISSDKIRELEHGEKVLSGPDGVCFALIKYRGEKYRELVRTLGPGRNLEDEGRLLRLDSGDD